MDVGRDFSSFCRHVKPMARSSWAGLDFLYVVNGHFVTADSKAVLNGQSQIWCVVAEDVVVNDQPRHLAEHSGISTDSAVDRNIKVGTRGWLISGTKVGVIG
jgi:hypothetical protein